MSPVRDRRGRRGNKDRVNRVNRVNKDKVNKVKGRIRGRKWGVLGRPELDLDLELDPHR